VADTATCHVVDSAGKPVANAVVYSVYNRGSDASPLTTDNLGNFTVDNMPARGHRDYIIDAPGFAPTGESVAPGENTLTLGLPTKLTGKVVDSHGQPVSGAVVVALFALTFDAKTRSGVQHRISYFIIHRFTARYTAKTDSTGTYTLDGLSDANQFSIRLNDPRYITAEVLTAKGGSDAPLLTGEAAASISGKMVRQDGKPIDDGIEVTARSSEGKGDYPIQLSAEVAADGTYTITSVPPGSYTVGAFRFTKNGSDRWVNAAPVNVAATIATPGASPDLVIKDDGIVAGSVLDADTKQPVSNVYVIFRDISHGDSTRITDTITGADGKFTVHVWVGKSSVSIDSVPDDYIENRNTPVSKATGVGGQTVTMDPILLKRAQPVSGTVVDDSGKPVPNVVLKTQYLHGDEPWVNIPDAVTNENGGFSIRDMVPGDFFIDAGADWIVVSPKSLIVPLASPIKLVLKKSLAAAVQGIVVDTTNAPIAGVDIAFSIYHDNIFRMRNDVYVVTGADGTYTVPDAPLDPSGTVQQTNGIRWYRRPACSGSGPFKRGEKLQQIWS
jgi:5-hydroxyisourate hydrolase-like protein (transthyretin family)